MSKLYDVVVLGAGPAGLAGRTVCRKITPFYSNRRKR